ncbi:MAG: hypothetical protein AAF268_06740 [Cyanobacteria bacterium P01_A01_bin.3]
MLAAYTDDGIVTVMSEIYERTSEHEWNYEVSGSTRLFASAA